VTTVDTVAAAHGTAVEAVRGDAIEATCGAAVGAARGRNLRGSAGVGRGVTGGPKPGGISEADRQGAVMEVPTMVSRVPMVETMEPDSKKI
jgi:hypothetical protein